MDNTKEFRDKEKQEHMEIPEEYKIRMEALITRAQKMFPTADDFMDALEGWITDREAGFGFTLDLGGEK